MVVVSKKKVIFAQYYISVIMRSSKKIALVLLFLVATVGNVVAQVPDVDSRIVDARDMLDRKCWGEAQIILEGLADDIPQSRVRDLEWVEFELVRCAVELGVANVEDMANDFIATYPSSIYANEVYFIKAISKMVAGSYDAAEEAFMQVEHRRLDARDRECYEICLGAIYFQRADYPQAEVHLNRVGEQSIYYPHVIYFKSYIAYTRGDNATARRGFEEIANHDSYKDLVPFYLLQLDYRDGNYADVVRRGVPLMAVASTKTRDDLIRVIAESNFLLEEYEDVVRYMSAEYAGREMTRQESYIYGYALYRVPRYEEASTYLEAAAGGNDELAQNASYHLGGCLLELGDKAGAAEAFLVASSDSFNPEIQEDALLNYVRLLCDSDIENYDMALAPLQRFIDSYSDSVHIDEVKQLLIMACYKSNNYARALELVRNYPNPDSQIRRIHQRVALFRAVEEVESGNLDEAESLLSEAEQIGIQNRYFALVRYWQGEVAYAKGDFDRAIEKYGEYIFRAPAGAVERLYARYGLGYARFAKGEMAEAAEEFAQFVRDYATRDEYLYDAHNRMGDAYYSEREFTDARNAYNIVVASASPERHYASYQLAMIDGLQNRTSSKIERLTTIVTEAEGDYVDDAWYELGRTYIGARRYSDGATTLQEFVDTDSTSEFHVSALSDLALAYYNLGSRDDARRCYEQVVDRDPQSSAALEAMRGIREIYIAEDRLDEYFAYAERSGVQSDMSAAARDSLTFVAARRAYLDGERENAKNKLVNYLNSFERGYNRSEALFYLSDCYINDGDNDAAMETMQELLSQGRTEYSERVLGVYARMAFDMERYRVSADAYRELYDVAHDASRRAAASEGYVEAALKCDDNDFIVSMADDVASLEYASAWARRKSKLAKANTLRGGERNAEAQNIYAALAQDVTTAEGAEAYYHLLEYKYEAGELAEAEQMVYNMGDCGSMYWQAKIFLLLGDIMADSGNSFQARATYQSIVDGYSPADDGIIAEAEQRIAAMSR